ncbi:MAG TPA: glycosyl hydrolase family 18 protein, partial [Spirochaetia bacterium]
VLLSVGGGTAGATKMLDAVTADPDTRARFIENTMMLVYLYSLDGIDVDWEYPTAANSEIFADVIHELAGRLHAEGRLLSIAVSADGWHGQYYPDAALQDADFLNIMAYDDGYGVTPPIPHSSYWFARSALDYWLVTRLVPPWKANLGVPFFGRSLKDRHSISYARLRKMDSRASASDVSGEFGYNGFDTLRAKTVNLARARAGGIMIWQLNQDAHGSDSLLNAIFDAIKEPIEPMLVAGEGAAPVSAVE